jgi:protein-disulfide isomerase
MHGMASLQSSVTMKATRLARMGVVLVAAACASYAWAEDKAPAFKINGKVTTLDEVAKDDQASFYEIEKKKYDLVDRIARDKYLEHHWQSYAKELGKSVAEAQKIYEEKNLKVSEKEVKETLEKFKDHPSLAKLEKKEQEKQIRDYLTERARKELTDGLVDNAIKKGDLVIMFPEPEEPIYNVPVNGDDVVRYGPEPSDTKPVACKAEDCPITIVEYSEFQCPFCSRVVPDTKRILGEYKGKIRWVVRDFPLSFHDRARPAAIAAKCANEQGKYWQMYATLFENQRNLGDADLKSYADKIGLDKGKFDSCVATPGPMEAKIDKNFQSGVQLGVSGTPAFFINGRRLSGAMPYGEFKRVIDDEISGKHKKKT